MKHKFISSKMKKGNYLINDRVLSKHVPETKWYYDSTFNNMLERHSVLYIKPDKGSSGNGIIRVKKLNTSESLISFKATNQKIQQHTGCN